MTTKQIVGIVIGVLIIFGIYSYNKSQNDMAKVKEIITEDITYQDSVMYKEAFMEGCLEEGGTVKYCNCIYGYLVDELGMQGFLEMSIDYAMDESDTFANNMLKKSVKFCLE